jgi:F0F1-type ATP synthase membrane subunit c/vacuolar-type H+-ATPase subunit K
LLFEVVSSTILLASTNFSVSMLSDPVSVLTTGSRGADLWRLGSLLDMFGYLTALPLALYLRTRFRDESGIDFFTLAGILFMVMGALAAVMLAYAAAPLIREYATNPSAKDAIKTSFVALYRITTFGMWQTLNPVLAGIWVFGVGRMAWKRHERVLASVLIAIGLVLTAGLAAHLSGIFPGS